jgi:hypothetical protein
MGRPDTAQAKQPPCQTNETSRRDGGVKTTLNVFISS